MDPEAREVFSYILQFFPWITAIVAVSIGGWAFTTWLALPALEATSTTKAVNWLTNAGALAVFAARGAVLWSLAIPMAAANALGGFLGAHTAIRGGVRTIRLATAAVSLVASAYLLVRWARG